MAARASLPSPSFPLALAGVLLAGLLLRLAYLFAQSASDPNATLPSLDGAYYFEWARSLARGSGGPQGAFYLAPLFAYGLALFLRVFGENFWLLYLVQHLLCLAAAVLLAVVARRAAGSLAGIAAATLFVLYPPLLFFASKPLGEPLALGLLAAGVCTVGLRARRAAFAAGALVALAVLARPSLLPLPFVWSGVHALGRRFPQAGLLLSGALLVLLPVGIRNLAASGHFVLISSNGGVTAFHGNGPGARGIFTRPFGMTGSVATQREEATALARALSRRGDLDPVEADRFWGRQALRTRLADPKGSLILLGRRLLLMLDNHELGLDYHPALDPNPFRPLVRWPGATPASLPELEPQLAIVPFGLLFGLTVAGLALGGFRRSGGWPVWSAIGVAALAPLLFYASSRYRLPLAALMVVPAGTGVAGLLGVGTSGGRRRRPLAAAAGLAALALSLAVPFADLRAVIVAGALANRAATYKARGELGTAERYARAALEIDPVSTVALFNLGVTLEAEGRPDEAEAAYRRAVAIDPGQADAAANLAALLITRGKAGEAIPLLRRALAHRPQHRACWVDLVIALAQHAGLAEARAAAEEARASGVELGTELLDALRPGNEPRTGTEGKAP